MPKQCCIWVVNTSLFIEETKRSIKQKSEEKGIDWRETELVDPEIILDLIGNPAEHFYRQPLYRINGVLNNWLDTISSTSRRVYFRL